MYSVITLCVIILLIILLFADEIQNTNFMISVLFVLSTLFICILPEVNKSNKNILGGEDKTTDVYREENFIEGILGWIYLPFDKQYYNEKTDELVNECPVKKIKNDLYEVLCKTEQLQPPKTFWMIYSADVIFEKCPTDEEIKEILIKNTPLIIEDDTKLSDSGKYIIKDIYCDEVYDTEWSKFLDKESKNYYYHNNITKITQWERPVRYKLHIQENKAPSYYDCKNNHWISVDPRISLPKKENKRLYKLYSASIEKDKEMVSQEDKDLIKKKLLKRQIEYMESIMKRINIPPPPQPREIIRSADISREQNKQNSNQPVRVIHPSNKK